MSDSKSVVPLNAPSAALPRDASDLVDRAERLQRRAERELAARHEAERLLESKSLELFAANQRLKRMNADLEERVEARTRQVEEARKQAVKIGTTDYLTGIANRFDYSQHLERALFHAASDGRATGLLLLDLDGFKQINDTYGHRHGDELLIAISHRLASIAGPAEFVARIGGDEFAVIIEGLHAAAVENSARRFTHLFEVPITIDGVTINAHGSFGLAISPDQCRDAANLQRFADLALYQSKKEGSGGIVLFATHLLHDFEHRQRMEEEFRAALKGKAIDLVYQPIFCIETGQLEKVEALARWTDSNGVEVSPAYFIPLAEECGMIRGVGRTLLEKALLETRQWIESGHLQRVSFNVSPLEFLDEGFADAVVATLARVGFPPHRLMLEITEGVVIQSLASVEQIMRELGAYGIRFALDDFGRGYSDLSTLAKLPICVLKIDRSLLVDADEDPAARVILRSVVTLCRELRIRSICEGAETQAQLDFLAAIGCDLVQGFISGRPGPIEAVASLPALPRAATAR